MKILTYSDLHLEFGAPFQIPADTSGDVLVLAGDIVSFNQVPTFSDVVEGWDKPILFVTGNHEYYVNRPWQEEDEHFHRWLARNHPNVTFLRNEATSIGGVQFFGGTMWTDFAGGNPQAMANAQRGMNDYRLIHKTEMESITPEDTIGYHGEFLAKLLAWFEEDLPGPRVVISHHAPVVNSRTQYGDSPLRHAFNSLDMPAIIEKHQPALWIYGHTHECDDQMLGKTRIISNQRGYPLRSGGFECKGFDAKGLPIVIPT